MTTVWVEYLVVGSFVGFMSGALGTGGGLLLVPLLMCTMAKLGFATVIALKIATVTSLSIMFITSLMSAATHYHQNNLKMELIYPIIITTMLGGIFLTPLFDLVMPSWLVLFIFTVLCFSGAYRLLFSVRAKTTVPLTINKWLLALFGFPLAGFCGLLGISGGSMTMSILRHGDFTPKELVAATACLALPITFSTELSYLFLSHGINKPDFYGYIYLPALITVVTSSLFFSWLGARLAKRLSPNFLKKIMGVLLLLVSIKLAIEVI